MSHGSISDRIPRRSERGSGARTSSRGICILSPLFLVHFRAQITLNDPYEGVREPWRTFLVHVPGLMFTLAVGKTVDESLRQLCIHDNPGNPISVSDWVTGQFEQLMVRTLRKAHKTQAYLRSKAKVDEERRSLKPDL